MKNVQDDDLEDFALEFGGTVDDETGRVYNSAGNRAVRHASKVAPDPDEPMRQLIAQVAELAKRPVQVSVAAPAVTVQSPKAIAHKPTAWTFEFERNNDGTIKSITASPKE